MNGSIKRNILLIICLFILLYHYSLLKTCTVVIQSSNSTMTLSLSDSLHSNLPPLYIITPTYYRAEQMPELIRLSHTLMLVPNVHWLVIEDAQNTSDRITEYLKRTGLNFTHLSAPMPEIHKNKEIRGVSGRNRGLEWLRANATHGVFYFADDDNTYDLQLFEEIRNTKRVSMFPVGLVTELGISTPLLRNGRWIGFYDGWIVGRKFPVDMAGFAVSVQFLHARPNAIMLFETCRAEDSFLRSLAPFEPDEIEFFASNCTKILVWHTQTKKNKKSIPINETQYNTTNLIQLKKFMY